MSIKNEKNKDEFVEDFFENDMFLANQDELEDDKKDEVIEELFKKYKKIMEQKKIFQVYASRSDTEGNLYCTLEDNITGIIPNKEVEGKRYDPYYRAKKINKKYSVVVTNIDKEKRMIELSYDKAKKIHKNVLRKKLIRSLKEGKTPRVKARIMFVSYNNRVYIDMQGVDLLGYIPIDEWKHGYEYNLKEHAEKNKVIEVEVMRYLPEKPKENKNEAFICSRKRCLPDPWIGIEERVPLHSTLVVTCVDKKAKNFFGRSEGIEIDILCEYPEPEKNIVILEGVKYKAHVYAVSEEKKLLKARIFDIIKR